MMVTSWGLIEYRRRTKWWNEEWTKRYLKG